MSSSTKEFLADNFANIAIALSIIFLIFELYQNRQVMERELVFMEAQTFQSRAELSMESVSFFADPEIIELEEKALKEGVDSLNSVETTLLFNANHLRKIVIENTHYQVEIGLVDEAFWNTVGVGAIKRGGGLFLDLKIPMRPSFEAEVRSVLEREI